MSYLLIENTSLSYFIDLGLYTYIGDTLLKKLNIF